MMMAPVNGRLLYFSAAFNYDGKADQVEAEKAVTDWCRATIAANPRRAEPEAEDWLPQGSVYPLIFTGIAVLVVAGVIIILRSR